MCSGRPAGRDLQLRSAIAGEVWPLAEGVVTPTAGGYHLTESIAPAGGVALLSSSARDLEAAAAAAENMASRCEFASLRLTDAEAMPFLKAAAIFRLFARLCRARLATLALARRPALTGLAVAPHDAVWQDPIPVEGPTPDVDPDRGPPRAPVPAPIYRESQAA